MDSRSQNIRQKLKIIKTLDMNIEKFSLFLSPDASTQ